MGGTASSPTPVQVQAGVPDPSFDQKTSGVRVTLAGQEEAPAVTSNDSRIKEAYAKGKQEGVASFQSQLEQVAAQVYDGVHTRLTQIQSDSIQRSKQMVSSVQTVFNESDHSMVSLR
jgi:hypothetical protein